MGRMFWRRVVFALAATGCLAWPAPADAQKRAPAIRVERLYTEFVEGLESAIGDLGSSPAAPTAKRNWGPEQVLGPPDTTGPGDIVTAWASSTRDDADEWIETEYAKEITPIRVHVHETYNPGALYKVTGFSKSGEEFEIWSGEDPVDKEAGHGWAKIDVPMRAALKKIKIYLKSKEVPGWNEIDAIGLEDEAGKTHWAVAARASSTYASGDAVSATDAEVDFVGDAPAAPVTGVKPIAPLVTGDPPPPPGITVVEGPLATLPAAPVLTPEGFAPSPFEDSKPAAAGDATEARLRALEELVRALQKEIETLKARLKTPDAPPPTEGSPFEAPPPADAPR